MTASSEKAEVEKRRDLDETIVWMEKIEKKKIEKIWKDKVLHRDNYTKYTVASHTCLTWKAE